MLLTEGVEAVGAAGDGNSGWMAIDRRLLRWLKRRRRRLQWGACRALHLQARRQRRRGGLFWLWRLVRTMRRLCVLRLVLLV